MKKILFLLLLTGVFSTSARSQVLIALIFGDKLNTPNIEFGLNVGGNLSKLKNYPEAQYSMNLNLGLYFNFKMGDHFYLHPELQFLNTMGSSGRDLRYLPDPGWDVESLESRRILNYGTLVLLPRYKLLNQLYFEAGFHGSFLLSANDYLRIEPAKDTEEIYRKYNLKDYHRFDAGFDVGLGFKFGEGEGLNLSFRYSHGFVNILKDGSQPAEHNRGFHLQACIPIGVGKEDVQNIIDQ
jgi:hypothetical protein